jgi:hypothetical protein
MPPVDEAFNRGSDRLQFIDVAKAIAIYLCFVSWE